MAVVIFQEGIKVEKKIKKIEPIEIENENSPHIVLLMDTIRNDLEDKDLEQYGEICWFLRKYPRIFRYHLECLEYRLSHIRRIYCDAYDELCSNAFIKEPDLKNVSGITKEEIDSLCNSELFEISFSNIKTKVLYWEFESLLSAVNISLDIMVRILGTAYKEQLPPNFNKACKKKEPDEIINFMKSEKENWVNIMKDYRDCFTHYTPVDTLLSIKAIKCQNEWMIYGKLPINPNERDITRFEYDFERDVLSYSIDVYRKIKNFDKCISQIIEDRYKMGNYPLRTNGLFSVGRRERKDSK